MAHWLQKFELEVCIMKNLNTFKAVLITLVLSTMIVACGKNDNSNPVYTGTPNPNIYQPGIAYPGGFIPPPNIGFYAQNDKMTALYNNPQHGTVLNTDSAYLDLTRDAMGVCNRAEYSGGLADCQSWINGYNDVVFLLDSANSSQGSLIIRSYPISQSNNSYYYYSLPSAKTFFLNLIGFPVGNTQGVYAPMVLKMPIFPWNNSKGFKAQNYGPSGSKAYGVIIDFEVAEGKVENQFLNFQINFNGSPALSGRMNRCATASCGL